MKRLCGGRAISVFFGASLLCCLLIAYMAVKGQVNPITRSYGSPSPIQTSHICMKNNGRNCTDDKQLEDLIKLIQNHFLSMRRESWNSEMHSILEHNEWALTSSKDVIKKLASVHHQMTMKSNSNSTIFERGSGTGVTKEADLTSSDKVWWSALVAKWCAVLFGSSFEMITLGCATSRIESKTWVDSTSSCTLVRSFSAFASRSLGSLWIRSWTLRYARKIECICPDFKELLENYCSAVFGDKVRIMRTNKTIGLIKARLLGARMARGDVIIPLDAHMEVQETWLVALLYEIRRNNKTLATSMLDWMKPLRKDIWSYQMGSNSYMCVFTWDMGFGFGYPRPEILEKQEKHPMTAFPWAIYKDFFTEVGELDEGMERWGGENLDLPIRVWLFGGRVVQVPCSHAAHMERQHQRDYRQEPHSQWYPIMKKGITISKVCGIPCYICQLIALKRFGWDKYINRNYRRVVDVWFDDYKKYVYRMKPQLEKVHVGDLSERFEVKKRAKHNFEWFLRNIYPELGLYDISSFGYDWLRNLRINKCLHYVNNEFILWNCLGQPNKEGVWLTNEGHMRTDLQYWQVQGTNIKQYKVGPEGATGYYQADWITKWIHWKGGPMMMYRKKNGVEENICMEAYNTDDEKSKIRLNNCDPENKYQRWEWKEYTDDYRDFIERKFRSRFNSDYHRTLLTVMSESKWS
ncbi:hypothetical protein LSH36_32g00042 [Paralvinella palmiformis]|uniref:Polypeptide N-acetylgalactosaminyltransferase n=1 Tax=Paralvinella palmiformis TaxID=53620 RepID=A0AAD9NE64_9ANNE|nr:hypothetical protein LSH36_32g00042 [Paralvinella palmiformis]